MLHCNYQGKLNPKCVYSREKHANHSWSYDKEALHVAGPSSCFKKGFQLNPVSGSLLPPVTRTLSTMSIFMHNDPPGAAYAGDPQHVSK